MPCQASGEKETKAGTEGAFVASFVLFGEWLVSPKN